MRPVEASARRSLATHTLTVPHATTTGWDTPATATTVLFGVADCGLNVTSPPPLSTAVHWIAEGQAIDERLLPASTTWRGPLECGASVGANVNSLPSWFAMVHWVAVGQAMALGDGVAVPDGTVGS